MLCTAFCHETRLNGYKWRKNHQSPRAAKNINLNQVHRHSENKGKNSSSNLNKIDFYCCPYILLYIALEVLQQQTHTQQKRSFKMLWNFVKEENFKIVIFLIWSITSVQQQKRTIINKNLLCVGLSLNNIYLYKKARAK